MKKISFVIILSLLFLLSGCETDNTSKDNKRFIIDKIDEYATFNEVTEQLHDDSLDDVAISDYYVPTDFFNYQKKDSSNVELEYSNHYDAFSTLGFLINYINVLEEFDYDLYYELPEFRAMLKVTLNGDVVSLDYYQYFEELNIASRQYFILKEVDEQLFMERYSTTYDIDSESILLKQKLTVYEGSHIETVEYIPKTMTYTYIYNSYENQEYFKYKGFFDDVGDYTRETIEYYIPDHNSYVSYDIKDDELEDYIIKVFKDGHRVLKYDVNIFSSKDTETDLTWNLLSVDGWTQVSNEGLLYLSSNLTMSDYHTTIQLSGYGKVSAEKEIVGDITNEDISLENYGLNSDISLSDLEDARLAFVDSYITTIEEYGFLVSNEFNFVFIENYFLSYDDNSKMNDFVNSYR